MPPLHDNQGATFYLVIPLELFDGSGFEKPCEPLANISINTSIHFHIIKRHTCGSIIINKAVSWNISI